MNRDRKEIIIKEIRYWKQTRLLPEQYCNYLLTLYSEGEEDYMKVEDGTTSSRRYIKSILTFFLVQILLMISVVVIYFTDFPFLLQMASGIFCGVIILKIAKKTLNTLPHLAHLYFLISAITMLLILVQITQQVLPGNRIIMLLVILINCSSWLLIGMKFKLKYFIIAGSTGIILGIVFFIY
ncbi:hypothetical protein [Alkalihalobacterium elongatum]|uniref:hypothetical protein n=1 Tax=Alkalihalobacterium elongatum TaxID=2675466 RepID=UPI001C1FCD68|nr:hypothetical protein [Alkalihalobacterium elongatum]